ncbi:methylenetetrahydrofolate reductase C-terminal domain-containing protein [Desulfallas thermosapovorans]|uniref:Methylene-tetrahydrofolate reductase-like protein n=1 Tax=Desulfallas thermosapovorans DSM 6562 TaxID=1121431 RepID=A0A5S4ZNF9_9FIRM|nr:methylenetetrahydrofolate reductase C-terminal domain-containing protein [Desulfallas thermosapovorans]TYO92736.1 methylene-tetrahydrofolate reductase-like protein [Desulfallas thermosapovorans DSM 6562]
MIGTVWKPEEEILGALQNAKNIFVVGCGGCAKVARSGGQLEVDKMVKLLESNGKNIIAAGVPERTCYIQFVRTFFDPKMSELKECDAVLVLGCGGAVQVVRQATEEYGLVKHVYSGLNSVGHMDTIVPGEYFLEQCSECGDCVLNLTGAICPVTKCSKGLLNGPCGGSKDGKCEVDPERDCAWVLIYERLKALGQLENVSTYWEPKDYSKAARPRKLVF